MKLKSSEISSHGQDLHTQWSTCLPKFKMVDIIVYKCSHKKLLFVVIFNEFSCQLRFLWHFYTF